MADPYVTGEKYCEVYDEPRHRFHLRNDYTNIYEIEIPPEELTQFHRHCEDTVYFVIADADVQESFQNKPSVRTQAPCGGTLCRAHRDEPLIHQVKNIGNGKMHMIGAEALRRPTSAPAIQHESHCLSWESSRFRVYDVIAEATQRQVNYRSYGLLVALREGNIRIEHFGAAGGATVTLAPGNFIWTEPEIVLSFDNGFCGLYAQWI